MAHMGLRTKLVLGGLALAMGPAAIVTAQTQSATAPATTPAASPTPTLDPVAVQALKGMGAYLKSLGTFEVQTNAIAEDTLNDTDLKISFGYQGIYRVKRPNEFYVQLKSDRQVREYFYDGKSFTVNVPRQNLYATVSAPATIRDTVDALYTNFGVSLPLADLFYWADDNAPTDGIVSAIRVGYAKVGGRDADQFAYRGPDLDWQIWIARGSAPVPLRIVLTARSGARASYSADLTWNTTPRFDPASFTFKPASNATPVEMAKANKEGQ